MPRAGFIFVSRMARALVPVPIAVGIIISWPFMAAPIPATTTIFALVPVPVSIAVSVPVTRPVARPVAIG